MISGKQIYTILASYIAISARPAPPDAGIWAPRGIRYLFGRCQRPVLISWNKNASLNAPEARCRLNGSQF